MKSYFTNIFKSDTSSDDMKEKVDRWLDSFEKFHKKYTIMSTESLNSSFPGESRYIAVRSTPGSLIKKTKKDVIAMKPSKCYILMFLLNN